MFLFYYPVSWAVGHSLKCYNRVNVSTYYRLYSCPLLGSVTPSAIHGQDTHQRKRSSSFIIILKKEHTEVNKQSFKMAVDRLI